MKPPSAMTHAELVAEVVRLRAQAATPQAEQYAADEDDPFDARRLTLFDQVHDAVIVTDSAMRIRFLNAAAVSFYGWRPEEVIGAPVTTVAAVTSYQSGSTDASAREVLLREGFWRDEVVQRHRDGSPLEVDVNVQVFRDTTGAARGFVAISRDISARRRLEAEQTSLRLRAEEAQQDRDQALAQIDALVASSPTGVAFLDRQLRFMRVNQALAEINGLPAAEHLGRTLAEIFPLLASRVEPLLWQVLAEGEAVHGFELQGPLLMDAGTLHHFLVSYYPVRFAGGEIGGVGVVVTDVTRLKRTEAALLASERVAAEQAALLNTLIARAPIGMAFVDLELRYRLINAELAAMNRRSPAEHLGRTVAKMLPLEGVGLEALLRQVITTDMPLINVELAGERPTEPGIAQVWLASYYPIHSGDGSLLGVGIIVAEVTAQRQAADADERHHRDLQAIVETIEEGVLAVYPDGTIAALNSAARRMRDLPPEADPHTWDELLTASPFDLIEDGLPVTSREPWPMARVLRGERFTGLEVCLKRAGSSELRWFAYNGTPVYDRNGAFALGVVTGHDITRQKGDEAALRAHADALSRANAELARALRLKDEFLAMMSHELRTPLNAVLGITDAVDEGLYGPLTEQQHKALGTVAQSGRHLLALLSDILDLARIEAGIDSIERVAVDIELVCYNALAYVQAPARQKDVQLSLDLAGVPAALYGDERRLTQILVNLLDNAVKFTPPGGKVGLEVLHDPAHERVQLMVWDTGIGIAPADFERLFQPFTQIDGRLSREYGGIGLGLTLVRRLVELHGGSVGLESTLGQGSRFTVSLPRLSPSAREHGVGAPAERAAGQLEGLRIVIADDHEPTLSVYNEVLVYKGLEVATARTGAEAVALVEAFRPDIVVMDIQMPGMDGLEAIGRLRTNPATRAIPIIALTALAMPGDRERCLAAGADLYLAKPVAVKRLIEAICDAERLSVSGASRRPAVDGQAG